MSDKSLVGQNYTPPDLVAKVTGRAKYAEDYRADGMLFTKLLLSPMPHARVRSIDTRAALAMPGVKAILTADDLPDLRGAERALTNEPLYQGEPILAVAAVDERTAAEAIERIDVDLEALPFVTDPVESLRPGSANARLDGNVWITPPPAAASGGGPPQPVRPKVQVVKWTEHDFASAPEGGLPMGEAPDEWSYGDLDAGFKSAAIVVDETFVVQSTGHQPMESRSAMAYWQNGKLYLHGSTQSVARTLDPLASWLGIDASNIVLISEVLRRRLRQQGRRGDLDGDSRSAVEEGRRAGHDAHQPRRGALHRQGPHRDGRPREGRFQQGRTHHRARPLHRGRQRIVRADGRLPLGGACRVADLAADRDAVAGPRGADQHAAALAAALTRTDAGQRDHGAGRDQGREETGPRSGWRSAASIRRKARRSTDPCGRTGRGATSPARS